MKSIERTIVFFTRELHLAKAEELGIRVVFRNEAYIFKTCNRCSNKKALEGSKCTTAGMKMALGGSSFKHCLAES
ncbi:hypothetical protein G9A89_020571 [Geosiphon pyriformis]|nr:hypothetical protein G9A89_020571 [Geosiphon pyriformis]